MSRAKEVENKGIDMEASQLAQKTMEIDCNIPLGSRQFSGKFDKTYRYRLKGVMEKLSEV